MPPTTDDQLPLDGGQRPEAGSPSFASALSTRPSLHDAAGEAISDALGQLGATPDLALLFTSHPEAAATNDLAERVCEQLGSDQLLGCTGESIAGVGREVEGQPALSVWLASLPGTRIVPMGLRFERTADGGSIVGWPESVMENWPEGAGLLLLGEPFSFPADVLLARLNEDRPGVPVIGGMASGGSAPGENRLLLGRRMLAEGAVACRISGATRMSSLVSQGCRPIGQPFVVTRAERNVIYQLGGKTALDQLRAVFEELPNSDKELVQRGLHLGRVVSEYRERFEQGDFLIRNVMGIQAGDGSLAVGDYIRAGQTVQFHVRDQETADQELKQLLAKQAERPTGVPRAALLFTCNGRGTRLFDEPNHDAGCVQSALGEIPLAGFFAQGEIGPVGGQNFLHGFTASLALFGSPDENR